GEIRLHYIEWRPTEPTRKPALLLLHGTSSNALYWRRLAQLIPQRRVVALDLRGHGRSARPGSGYSVVEVARDAAHVVDELRLGKPLVVGHSWGVAVGIQLAVAYPAAVMGAVLVDGPVYPLSRCLSWEEAERQMRTLRPVYRDVAEAEAAQAALLRQAWGDDLRDFVRAGLTHGDAGWTPVLPEGARLEMLRSLYDFRPDELIPKVTAPVLMIMGSDARDGVAPDVLACWRRGAQIADRRQGRVITYPCQHDIPLVQPRELALDVERVAEDAVSSIGARLPAPRMTTDWSD
ncbi:MAG: alpha/beta hydrolase, partial [Actinomycetota bacterium]|nr:alpha/beta hydrolase [Actinomycetota bacterium]